MDCFQKLGPLKGKSKGLKQIAIELGFEIHTQRVDEIRTLVSKHPAFSVQSNLEILARWYKINTYLNKPLKNEFLLNLCV